MEQGVMPYIAGETVVGLTRKVGALARAFREHDHAVVLTVLPRIAQVLDTQAVLDALGSQLGYKAIQ